jgi:hypothetical protein
VSGSSSVAGAILELSDFPGLSAVLAKSHGGRVACDARKRSYGLESKQFACTLTASFWF